MTELPDKSVDLLTQKPQTRGVSRPVAVEPT